jgi:hypothetical protein
MKSGASRGARPKPETVSSKPLFSWFDQEKGRRTRFAKAGDYSDGRITNWKSRGIPAAEVGRIANLMGISYEEYLTAAGVQLGPNSLGIRLQIEEAEAIKRLRSGDPDWRRYVLGLAMVDRSQQDLLLTTMRQAVPDYKVSDAYGQAPHVAQDNKEKLKK